MILQYANERGPDKKGCVLVRCQVGDLRIVWSSAAASLLRSTRFSSTFEGRPSTRPCRTAPRKAKAAPVRTVSVACGPIHCLSITNGHGPGVDKMISTLPAVQKYVSRTPRYACVTPRTVRDLKRTANRRHRRCLDRLTRGFRLDPERFDAATFDAPSLSTWDLW